MHLYQMVGLAQRDPTLLEPVRAPSGYAALARPTLLHFCLDEIGIVQYLNFWLGNRSDTV